MTLKTALAQGAALLKEAGLEPAKLTAEVLLAHALRKDRVYLIAHANDELTELGWIHYGRYLHERLKHKPTQYITKKQEFYGRDFYVAPGVLIPRPETELLIEAVLPHITGNVLDIGAGSGCIAVTVAVERNRTVYATDISRNALAIAARNAATHNAGVRLTQCDLGSAFPDHTFDVILSNPPYVADAEPLAREVRDWEPAQALFAGPDGLDLYRRLIPEASRLLKPGGLLAMEFGSTQAAEIQALLSGWNSVQIHQDLAGLDRFVIARRPA